MPPDEPYDASANPSGAHTDTERLRAEGARRQRVDMEIENLKRRAKAAEKRDEALEKRMSEHDAEHAAAMTELNAQLATGRGQFVEIEGQIKDVSTILASHLEEHAEEEKEEAEKRKAWAIGPNVVTGIVVTVGASVAMGLWKVLALLFGG